MVVQLFRSQLAGALPIALAVSLAADAAAAQRVEKDLVASISGPAIDRGVVTEIAWDGGTLIVQSATQDPDGQLSARYFAVPGPGIELRRLAAPPPDLDAYWKRKASRVSPTGLGRITSGNDAKLPMYGVGSLERRFIDAVDMGGTDVRYELRLGRLVLHSRRQFEPYDGEVWSWSPAALNRIAYVDGSGDLWIARADGGDAERLARGAFTLPAWSDNGRLLAIVERKDAGARWDVSVIHLPEKFRRER